MWAKEIEVRSKHREDGDSEGVMTVSTYKIIEVVATSEISWEDAATNAVATASQKSQET